LLLVTVVATSSPFTDDATLRLLRPEWRLKPRPKPTTRYIICRFVNCIQGTDAEQRAHGEESMNHHLEMSVEHTAQTGLDVVRLRGQIEVTA